MILPLMGLKSVYTLIAFGLDLTFLETEQTIIPDIFNGDCVPADALGPGSTFDLMKWYHSNHEEAQTRPIINKVIDGFKALGITTIGAIGYCFGGMFIQLLWSTSFNKIIRSLYIRSCL